MACRRDVEQAILDKVFDELVDRRNTFARTDNNRFIITGPSENSKTKARTRNQSMAIANRMATQINKSFNGYVVAYVTERSPYHPIDVSLIVDKRYVDNEYNKLPNHLKTDPNDGISNSPIVNYKLKAVDILNSSKADEIFRKGDKNNWSIDKILQELQVPKEQKQLILDKNITNREEIITSLLADNSYTVEINTAIQYRPTYTGVEGEELDAGIPPYIRDNKYYAQDDLGEEFELTKEQYDKYFSEQQKKIEQNIPTQHYSNLTVPGGTNYTENEIATPLITSSIKGHAQFSTDNGIGWFRSDDMGIGGEQYRRSYWDSEKNEEVFIDDFDNTGIQATKTRRILEVQSDLFQKGRDRRDLITQPELDSYITSLYYEENGKYYFDNSNPMDEDSGRNEITKDEYESGLKLWEKDNENKASNQFLQLLNKDNNWVTFFVKSIIQDSAKKGYEKVLFPTGNTASKVEGHSTLEEFKKQKEDRIKELEKQKENGTKIVERYLTNDAGQPYSSVDVKIDEEINHLKQELERVETEGFGALKPIYKFYENTVANILNKTYGRENVTQITDEYGNNWNEVTLDDKMLDNINLSPTINDEQERDDVNNNTGPNTRDSIDPDTRLSIGSYEKLIQFKKQQLIAYNNRLSAIKNIRSQSGISNTELEKLNKEEREIRLAIYGSRELGRVGIQEDIEDLENNRTIKAVEYYVQKDLDRLKKLANSNSITDQDEARQLAQFYIQAGTFRVGEKNPFFSEEDIFKQDEEGKNTPEFKLDEATRRQFEKWRTEVEAIANILDTKSKDILVEQVNGNVLVKNTYGNKKHTYKELTYEENGLKDADFFSMWTMDITHGIASHNGLLPQVMFSALVDSIESRSAWSRDISQSIDDMQGDIEKELLKLGQGFDKFGIGGIKGVSYNMFRRTSREGNQTNDLVQRQTKEFDDAESKHVSIFRTAYSKAREYIDPVLKRKKVNLAFENLKQWRRLNQIIIDPQKLGDATYKDQLVKLLGEKGYKQAVANQERLNTLYETDRRGNIDYALTMNNVATFDELPDAVKNQIKLWETNNSPTKGVEDYNSVTGILFGNHKTNNYMKYNSFIPRKYKADVVANIDQDRYDITDTNEETGYYDEQYAKIQANPVLANFYDKLEEFCEKVYDSMDSDLQEKTTVHTLPALIKTTSEILNDKHTGFLSSLIPAYRALMDKFRQSFGVVKQGNISYATTDPITGKPNAKVNDGFLRNNSRAIENRILIERAKFLQSFNHPGNPIPLLKIKNNTSIDITRFSPDSLALLAQYLHVDITMDQINRGDISAITNRLSQGKVDIGRLINDFSLHSVVQSLSFDLPKLVKYFSEMTMAYAARKDALPILSIMRKHYEKIKSPDTNNVGQVLLNRILGKKGNTEVRKVGFRSNANAQMDDWFERVVLDNYEVKHSGVMGFEKEGSFFGKTIYSTEERKELEELNKLIANETDPQAKAKLEAVKDRLGKTRTLTALYDNFLNWIRTLRLGYNISSMVTNFAEGLFSNVILAASDQYFDPKELFYGYKITRHSFLKNITFGKVEPPLAKKLRILVDKFGGIIDSRNELQKNYATKVLDAVNPHAGNQRVEYVNQTPIMVAILRTMKLTDVNGNESNIWDAYDDTGKLKDQFRTEENVKNWEALDGDQYKTFKAKFGEVRNLGHGNYDSLRGMMIKSNAVGKTLAMFKTWLPEALYWRFGKTQDNIRTGQLGVKGRYWSYGAGSAGLHGAVVTGIMFGPLGAIAGAAIGIGAGLINRPDTGIGVIQETIEATRLLLKKAIGMPVNLVYGAVTGKRLINTTEKSFGKGKYFDYEGKKQNFTIQDQRNLNANMADLAIQLALFGMMLMIKGMFWDDDDKSTDTERQAHNIIVSKLMQLSSQASSYVNPSGMYNSVNNIGAIGYLTDLSKEMERIQKWADGEDIIQSGVNAGKSGLWLQSRKTFLPGLLRDSKFGFGSAADRVYPKDSYYQKYFHSEEYLQEDAIKRQRSDMRRSLQNDEQYRGIEDEDKRKREIEKEVNSKIPTLKALKKKGYNSLKEYQESQ